MLKMPAGASGISCISEAIPGFQKLPMWLNEPPPPDDVWLNEPPPTDEASRYLFAACASTELCLRALTEDAYTSTYS